METYSLYSAGQESPAGQRQAGEEKQEDHRPELAELHAHVGGSAAPEDMWALARMNGLKLPVKTYWEFEKFMRLEQGKPLSALHDLYDWTQKIQTGPVALEKVIYETAGAFYRSSNVTLFELRINPMRRNRGGEYDLDHIIAAALRGLDRACLDYGLHAGAIFELDTRYPFELNEIIAKKALKYRYKGIVGIDLSGPAPSTTGKIDFAQYTELFSSAKKHGMGITVHAGEEHGTENEVLQAIDLLNVSRIGHGVQAAKNHEILKRVADSGTLLEVCPTSNLRRGIFHNAQDLKQMFETLNQAEVKYAICTDGAEMFSTNPAKERDFLLNNGILTKTQIEQSEEWARQASFLKV